MKFTPLALPEVIRIEPKVFGDERGFFYESYQLPAFAEQGIPEAFVQDNHSRSGRGVIRGLHYQLEPFAQGKLVRAVRGAIFDVAVDIRKGSPNFGRWVAEILSGENKLMLYLPPGFAHGFCALQDNTDVVYKVTQLYSPAHERGILWNDPEIGIQWPDARPYVVSGKDQKYSGLRSAEL